MCVVHLAGGCPTFKDFVSERGPEVLWHSYPPAQTHRHTSTQCWPNTENRTPKSAFRSERSLSSAWFFALEFGLKCFMCSCCFCLASPAAPEDIQLINVPSQTEAGLSAAHDWLQLDYLRCNNSILWAFFESRGYRYNAWRTSLFLPTRQITFTGHFSFLLNLTLALGFGKEGCDILVVC